MRIASITYKQFEGDPREWSISDLTLGPINLLVGKNAVGKSRCINVIASLSKLLTGQMKSLGHGAWDVSFEHDGRPLRYILKYENGHIIQEEFFDGSEQFLQRSRGGYGRIYAKEESKSIKFQAPDTDLAVVARRDSVQHPFFEPLHEWGESVRHFEFGKLLGHLTFIVEVKAPLPAFDERNTEQVTAITKRGLELYQDAFKAKILEDMAAVGYELEDVGVRKPIEVAVQGLLPGELSAIFVKERSLSSATEQNIMSQGMFRAFSLLTQLNFAELANKRLCVLVDDIGEGLDFERACDLIKLLRNKAMSQSLQLIMSTNDRYVMNAVPLDEWSVLERVAGAVRVRNYSNTREKFEEFKYTGLSNFDFLATDFVNEKETEAAIHE